MEVFIDPSCQICFIVTGGYLDRIFNLGSAELRLPYQLSMGVPQDGERGVAPQVITNVDARGISLFRFSNTGKIFVQRVAQQRCVTS